MDWLFASAEKHDSTVYKYLACFPTDHQGGWVPSLLPLPTLFHNPSSRCWMNAHAKCGHRRTIPTMSPPPVPLGLPRDGAPPQMSCVPIEYVKREGINLDEFACICEANGARAKVVRADAASVDTFREVRPPSPTKGTEVHGGSWGRIVDLRRSARPSDSGAFVAGCLP